MADDDIRQASWEGSIPIAFALARADTLSFAPPAPVYAARERFTRISAITPGSEDEVWFETRDGVALKWHYPIGVLFDLYGDGTELPWEITLHLRGFPGGEIPRPATPDACRSVHMSSVKESACLRRGDVTQIDNLTPREAQDLWEGVATNDMRRWAAVNALLVAGAPPRHVPVRVCRPGAPTSQDLVPVGATLREALAAVAPGALEGGGARAVVQGVEPPLDAPVVWLCATCASADNWLYVVLRQ
eukprot:m51a1_g2174 putative autophagy protein 5 (246) ;mRNA; f:75982-77032